MNKKESRAFSLIARFGSIKHAVRGIYIFVKNTQNSWIEIFVSIFLCFLGFYFYISKDEWILLLISIFILHISEAFNTSIEVHMDLTSPEEHPFARDTKDIAAGAVLISFVLLTIVSIIIFGSHLILTFNYLN